MAARTRGLIKSLHRPEYRALCDLLADTRRKAGIRQDALAKRLKRPQSFIAKYEGGERRLDVLEFIAISSAIGVDPRRLLAELMRKIGR